MKETNPIQRSLQLAPLSREHHEGLMFVWKIRQGIKNHVSLEKLRAFTGWYWKNHIKPHLYQEEKVLAPFISPTHPLLVRMKNDHDYIRELIIALDTEAQLQDLVILSDLLEKHIRFEERELFQYLEVLLTKEELDNIHLQLEQHPVSCEAWKDEFWVTRKDARS